MLGKKRAKKLIHKKTSDKLSSLKEEKKIPNKKINKIKNKNNEDESEESINSELASLEGNSSN